METKDCAIGRFLTVLAVMFAAEANAACPLLTSCDPPGPPKGFMFVDVTDTAQQTCSGIKAEHGGQGNGSVYLVAGVAAADFDRDGWVDVCVSWNDSNKDHHFEKIGMAGVKWGFGCCEGLCLL